MTSRQAKLLDGLGVDTTGLLLSVKDASELISEVYEKRKESSRSIADEARQEDLYDLVEQECGGKWKNDGANYANRKCPMSKCSSKDDAFYVIKSKNVGGCRVCEWERQGNGGGPIGFIMALKDLTWHEAARYIVNNRGHDVDRIVSRFIDNKNQKSDNESFKRTWSRLLDQGQRLLARSGAMAYLRKRGIKYDTARAFAVGSNEWGYGPYRGEQCILFPYFDANGELCAINRRVARDVEHDKCWFASGSQKRGYFGVSGWSGLTWVIEGEINVMSAYQGLMTIGRSDTVVSLSSESDIKNRVKEIKQEFEQVIVWCDKKEIASYVRENGLTAWATRQDANDLLLNGKLEACIEWILARYDFDEISEQEYQYFNAVRIFFDRRTCPTCEGLGVVCWDVEEGAGFHCPERVGARFIEVEVEMTEAQWDASW